jgi:ADP-ribose pyrophosphatase YjhB (NUDIX family)
MRPDLTVAAVVEQDGRFLLVEERVGNLLVFNQPAGHVERGEKLIDAVVRETLEETAWKFVPQALVGVYLWEHPDKQRNFLRFAFSGIVSDHDPHRRLDHGIKRALWMSREQAALQMSRLRSPMVLRCMDDYLSGKSYSLDIVQHLSSGPAVALASYDRSSLPIARVAADQS